ncbi:MAG TPA: hypothetical protein VF401_02720 [Candidatus Saccharimonadales bacterium]
MEIKPYQPSAHLRTLELDDAAQYEALQELLSDSLDQRFSLRDTLTFTRLEARTLHNGNYYWAKPITLTATQIVRLAAQVEPLPDHFPEVERTDQELSRHRLHQAILAAAAEEQA